MPPAVTGDHSTGTLAGAPATTGLAKHAALRRCPPRVIGDREMVAVADHLNDYVDDASTAGNNEIHNENHNEQQPPSNQAPTWRVSTT